MMKVITIPIAGLVMLLLGITGFMHTMFSHIGSLTTGQQAEILGDKLLYITKAIVEFFDVND